MPSKRQLERQHQYRMKKIEMDNLVKEYKEIESEAKYKRKNRLEESKFYIRLMFLLVIEIVIFSQIIMWRTGDLSALYALIGISATLSASLISYYLKAKAENVLKIAGSQGEEYTPPVDESDYDPDA